MGYAVTADGDCGHEIKRRLLLGRKVMTNLDSVLKSRDITLPTKVHLVKAMVFPVVMYGCEIWTVKKAECQRIDAFELWCWRRFFFFCMYFFFVSYMILYMFQCHSPKSSHPHSLPQSPKDCSIHLCLFCCLAYRVIVTFFLNSIYMH